MSALMVQSTQINGDKCREEESDKIQAVADAKFEDYLNLTTGIAEHLRDDVVMDMILEYEEQLYLLQRRFVQQLKDFQWLYLLLHAYDCASMCVFACVCCMCLCLCYVCIEEAMGWIKICYSTCEEL